MKYKKPFQFKQFSIHQKNAAMKVGTDSVLLGSWAIIYPDEKILDIGAGTGLLSIMLAQKANGKCNIDAVELDQDALLDAAKNIALCKWANSIHLHRQDFNTYQSASSYDLIISNPPFYEGAASPILSRNIARSSLAYLDFKSLLSGASNLLEWEGRFYLVLPSDVLKKLSNQAKQVNLIIKRKLIVYPSPNKAANRVLVEFCKSEEIYEPIIEKLIIRTTDLNYTQEYIDLTKDFYLNL